jgi:chromosome segregation protein
LGFLKAVLYSAALAMTDSKATLATLQKLLRSDGLKGPLSEMFCAGLPHALEGGREDRHEMQSSLLTMGVQAVGAARDAAQTASATCKQKVEAAQAELDARQAASASASVELTAAREALFARKDAVGERKRSIVREEQEHKRTKVEHEAAEKDLAGVQKSRDEVANIHAAINEVGIDASIRMQKAVAVWDMEEVKGDPALFATLPHVLAETDSAKLTGFDLVAFQRLQEVVNNKLAGVDAALQAYTVREADAHAEMLGAFAVADVARDRFRDATAEVKQAEAALEAAREKLKEAQAAAQAQQDALEEAREGAAKAENQASQCNEALELLKSLEAGLLEPAESQSAAMEVDSTSGPVVQ